MTVDAAACCAWRASRRRTSRPPARRRWSRYHARLGDAFARPRHRLERVARPVAHGRRPGYLPKSGLRRLPRRAAGRRQPRAAVHRPGAAGVREQRLHRAALRAAAARRGAGVPDSSGTSPLGRRQRLATSARRRRRCCCELAARHARGSSCCAATTSPPTCTPTSASGPRRVSCPTGAAGAAAGRRGVAHVAVARDRRPAPGDGRGAQLRLALAADLRGPARAPVRVPLGDGLPRARPRRPAEGDRRGPEALGDQAEGRRRDPDRDRDQEPLRRAASTRRPSAPSRSSTLMQGELAERPFALAHMNVHVWAETRGVADERAAQVAAYLNGAGAGGAAWHAEQLLAPLGDMPGNVTEEDAPGSAAAGPDERAPAAGRAGRGHPALAGHRRQPGHARGLALRRPGAADGDDPARRAAVLRAQRARVRPRAPAHRRHNRRRQEQRCCP